MIKRNYNENKIKNTLFIIPIVLASIALAPIGISNLKDALNLIFTKNTIKGKVDGNKQIF